MVQYNRLTSESAIIDYIKKLERDVRSLATKGSGDIIVTDPNTGVETLLGTLPDGSVGLDQFVNDTTPPGAPSTPTATGALESVNIFWDGKEVGGNPQPRDYDRTTIEMQVSGGLWAIVGTIYNETTFTVPKLEPAIEYTFRLKSYDKKNNESIPSLEVTATPLSILDDTKVDDALADLRAKDVALEETASQAAQDATDALQDLVDLNNALQSHPTTFYSDTEPTAAPDRAFVVGDWWVDTNDNNKIYVWNGNDFVVSADPRLDTALETLEGLTQPGGVLESMQDDIDGKITTHYGAAPASKATGDLWLDATDPANQVLKRWNGTAWVVFDNPRVQDAYTKAGTALDTADKKVQTFTGTTAPANNPTNDLGTGDLWINTTAGSGKISRWSGTAWVEVVDNGQSAANKALSDLGINTQWVSDISSQADKAITTFYGTTNPTGMATGDLWLAGNTAADGTTNYQMKRWDGDSWEIFENPRIQTAYTAAGTAQSTADAKIRTFAQTTAPGGMLTTDVGDLWINTTSGANFGQIKRWDGDSWDLVADTGQNAVNTTLAGLGVTQTWVNSISAQADKAITTFYGATAPTGMAEGDLWVTGTAGEPMKRYTNNAWVVFEDPNITAAYQTAVDAQETADGKIKTYAQATAPTGLGVLDNGDLWIDTDNGQISRWTGTQWTLVVDNGVTAANSALSALGINQTWVNSITSQADKAISTFYGVTAPTGMAEGDLWITGVAGSPMKRYTSGAWTNFEDPNVMLAYQKAADAESLADQKVKTFAQSAAPTGLLATDAGDLWIDTDDGKVHRWNGSAWIQVVDNGTAAANAALTALGINQTWVNNISSQADKAITTFYGTTTPTGMAEGDLWLTGVAGTPMKRYTSNAWVNFEDPNVMAAYQKAADAESLADQKVKTFAQSAAPTGLLATDAGDLWIDTDDGKVHRWNGSAWIQVVDNGTAAANAALTALGINQTWVTNISNEADRAIATFYGTTTPTGMETGDLWLSGVAGTPMKRYDGAAWVNFEDPNVTAAYTRAGDALTAADTKIITYAQTTAPTGLSSPTNDGDLWINTSTGTGKGQISRYSSAGWTLVTDNGVAEAQKALDTALQTAAKGADNKIANYSFEQGLTSWLNTRAVVDTTKYRSGTQSVKVVGGANNSLVPNANVPFDVVPGQTWRFGVWYQTSADYNGTPSWGKFRLGNLTSGTDVHIGSFTFLANQTNWTWMEYEYLVPAGVTKLIITIGSDHTVGTIWFDDAEARNLTELRAVEKAANDANNLAKTKIKTYAQSAAPTGLTVDNNGDLWLDTDDGKISRWNGSTLSWVLITDNGVNAANAALVNLGINQTWVNDIEAQADRAIDTFYGSTTPTGMQDGDLWLSGVAGDPMKRWNGTAWVAFENPNLATAYATANTANGLAKTKIRTFAQTTAPSGLTVDNTGDLWINTTAGPINGQVKRWDGDSWELVVESGTNSANAALTALGINAQWVTDIETQSDRAIATFYGTTTPTGMQAGDLWLSGVAGTPMKRWDGSAWQTFEDPNVQAAYSRAGDALTAADTKIITYAQTTAPTGLSSPANDGDLWINTATGANKGQISRYSGGGWTLVTDNGTAAANAALANLGIDQTWVTGIEAQADRAIDTFYGTTTPTGMQDGDLWLTGTAGDAMKRWNGTAWVSFENPNLATAYATANTANGLAKTKIRTFAQTSAPAGLTVDNTGDLWINTTAGTINGQVKRWSGTTWDLVVESGTISANAALTALGINQTWVNTITAQGDRAIATFFGTTAPTGMDTGDLWLSGVAGTPMKRWDGAAWVDFEDPNVKAAYQKAADAQSAADAKILTFAQATAPTGLDALNNGDLWIDTDDGKVYRYTHPNWVQVVDNGVAAANAALTALGINQTWVNNIAAEADRAIATFYGTTAPTGMETGDLWLSGVAGTPMKRYDGSNWVNFEDPNVMAAYSLADQAKTDANAKILTYAQTTAPTGLTVDNNGDLWINTSTGPLYGQVSRYTHPSWALVSDNGVLASQNTTAFSGNPSFDDWTAAYPNGYTSFGTQAPTKETVILTKGSATAARWNLTASGTQAGLQFQGSTVAGHLPNLAYYTVELDFYLVSGSLAGAGIILDWNGTSMTNNRATISLATEYPTVNTGKWYRMTKIMARPATITGTWANMGGYVMANWSSFGSAVKDIIIDWFNIRPSTAEEIKAYLAPTTSDVAAKGKIIVSATAPAVADQLVQNLWIDTTPIGTPPSPGNIPKRWDPTGTPQWRAVSDKGIADAAAAAVAAQGTASQALTNAGTALTAANARNRIVHLNTTPPVPADGWKDGDTWFKHETSSVSSPVIDWYRWSVADNNWMTQDFSETFLPSVNIGTGTYGSLAGTRLTAGSIEVEKLAVTDFTNLWPNPLFKLNDQGTIFYYFGTAYVGAEVAPVGGNIRLLASNDHVGSAGNTDAKAGDSYTVEADVKQTAGTLPLQGGVYTYTAAGVPTATPGQYVNGTVVETLANGWTRMRWIVTTSKAITTTAAVRPAFFINQGATGGTTNWLLSNVSMRKRGGGELVIDGSLTGRSIAAKSITVEQLNIATAGNLITEPDFTAGGASWGLTAGYSIDPTGARNGGPALKLDTTVGTAAKYNLPENIRIEPGSSYRMTAWVKSDIAVPIGAVSYYFKFFNAAGVGSVITGGNASAIPANTWTEVPSVVKAPADAVNISFGIAKASSISTGNLWIDYVSATRMGDAKLIVDGDIKAIKLDADEIWASTSWLGKASASSLTLKSVDVTDPYVDPDGNTVINTISSEVSSQGLKVANTVTDALGSIKDYQEIIKLGTFDEDFFAISKGGIPQITMNAEGELTTQAVTTKALNLNGEDIVPTLRSLPRGIIAWGQWTGTEMASMPSLGSTGGDVGLFEIGWDTSQDNPDRMYNVTLAPFLVNLSNANATTGSTVGLRMWLTTNGTRPSVGQGTAAQYQYVATKSNGFQTLHMPTKLISSSNGNYIRVLFSVYANCAVDVYDGQNVTLLVNDLGEYPQESGVTNNSGGSNGGTQTTAPAVTPKVTKTVEWGYTGVRSYINTSTTSGTAAGSTYNYNTAKAYQGLSPAGYNNLGSMYIFPNTITTTIAGSTINGVWVYLYFEHWYNASGGKARIRFHGHTALQSNHSLTTNGMDSAAWPRAAGRWVAVPSSIWPSFLSGAFKGFGLFGDGTYGTYGIANNARIRIKYTK